MLHETSPSTRICNLPAGKNFRCSGAEAVEGTTVFNPQDLDRSLREKLVQLAFPLYVSGFMQEEQAVRRRAEIKKDLMQHLMAATRVLLLERSSGALALILSNLLTGVAPEQERIYHLQGIIVDPVLQGRGVAYALLRKELRDSAATVLAFHTQSARMLGLARKLAVLDSVLAARIAPLIGTRHQEGVVDRGRYGAHSLYGDARRFLPCALRGIDFRAGDALIGAGHVLREAL